MQDSVSLFIDGMQINNFLSYTIESDIYTADDAFSVELANPEIQVKEGHRCELYVNGELELTGIIDRVTRSYDKDGLKLRVEGRDLMGLLVDSYCEEFITLQGISVKALAERLLRKVPFINRKKIVYQDNFSGKLKKKAKGESSIALLDAPHNFSHIEPGMTIFEVLKDYAGSRGLMFFCLPDGTMVFGKPKEKGEPVFSIICTKDGKDNNVLEGEMIKDISKRYSKITVIGQQQGLDGIDANAINTKATIEDKDFPFYKPMVAKNNNDYQSPKLHARMLLEKLRHEGFQLNYKVPGHSQNGKNWTINELCNVKDEILNVEGTYLIYGRTFEMSKQGVYTSLKLGIPGVIQ
jgi:prophage tail gpP-like protein